jgi:hypothetical protein
MTDFSTALMRLWPHGDEKIPGLRAGKIASAPSRFAKHLLDGHHDTGNAQDKP